MQQVNANDFMSGSAKCAVDSALADAKAQRVGGVTPLASPEGNRPTAEAGTPPRGTS